MGSRPVAEHYSRAIARLSPQRIAARYDNAQYTDENQRSWWMSDFLSAKSANNFQVRRQLRMRSRYEVSNNPYLFGIVNSNADDLVNVGPTLQCMLPSDADNKRIEAAWSEWAQEVELVEKLRTLKLAREVDGEGFLILKTRPNQEHPVKLYPVDVEADQITTPAPKNLTELWVDGLTLDPVTGRPVSYDVLQTHPGDYFFPNLNPLQYAKVDARYVVAWFRKFRPGQVRGIPVFTSALDLFNELRSFRRAVLNKEQIAAQFTAVLESEAPADTDGSTSGEPWDKIPIDRGAFITAPGGYTMKQFESGQSATSYEVYQEKCLGEACRPLCYPLNLALGTSQKFNFSSARLDHINYRNSLNVERADCDRTALDKIAAAWVEEASLVGLLPRSIRTLRDLPHEWHWPGYEPLDPAKDAEADHARLSNGTMTWQQFWASRGYDWKEVMAQQAAEREEIETLGLVFGDAKPAPETADEGDLANVA